jgi:hypothetical protein
MLGGSAKVWLIALAGMAAMVGWTELDRRITDDGKVTRKSDDFTAINIVIDDYRVIASSLFLLIPT